MVRKGISIRAPNGRGAKLSTGFFRGKDEVGTKLGEKMELALHIVEIYCPPLSIISVFWLHWLEHALLHGIGAKRS